MNLKGFRWRSKPFPPQAHEFRWPKKAEAALAEALRGTLRDLVLNW